MCQTQNVYPEVCQTPDLLIGNCRRNIFAPVTIHHLPAYNVCSEKAVKGEMCLRHELPPCSSGVYWEVESGDTLYEIALAVDVTLNELIQANPNIDPENLQVGQSICIPQGGKLLPNLKKLPNCPGGIFWEIAPGDTLYNIARQNNITVQRIIAANPGINPYNLRVGQFICLPGR